MTDELKLAVQTRNVLIGAGSRMDFANRQNLCAVVHNELAANIITLMLHSKRIKQTNLKGHCRDALLSDIPRAHRCAATRPSDVGTVNAAHAAWQTIV